MMEDYPMNCKYILKRKEKNCQIIYIYIVRVTLAQGRSVLVLVMVIVRRYQGYDAYSGIVVIYMYGATLSSDIGQFILQNTSKEILNVNSIDYRISHVRC